MVFQKLTSYYSLEGVNVSEPGSYIWQINIPESNLNETPKYDFVFLSPSVHPNSKEAAYNTIGSPGVVILKDHLQPTPAISGGTESELPYTEYEFEVPPLVGFEPSTAAYVGISLCSTAIALCIPALLVYKILGRRRERQLAIERKEKWKTPVAPNATNNGEAIEDSEVPKPTTLADRNGSTAEAGRTRDEDPDVILSV